MSNRIKLVLLLLILVALPLTILLVQQQQEIRQRAAWGTDTMGSYAIGTRDVLTQWNPADQALAKFILDKRPDIRATNPNNNEPNIVNDWAFKVENGFWHAREQGRYYTGEVQAAGTLLAFAKRLGWQDTTPSYTFTDGTTKTQAEMGAELWRAGWEGDAPPEASFGASIGAILPAYLRTSGKTVATSATPTSTPIPTSPPGSNTTLDITVGVGGITNASTPRNPTRPVTVEIYNTSNVLVGSAQTANVTFQNGVFKGTLNLGNFTGGAYVVKLKLGNTLKKLPQNITTIIAGQTNVLPQIQLISGDVNNDNKLDATDYANVVGCLNIIASGSCANRTLSDLNDDGQVDTQDLSILIVNFNNRQGD